MKRLKMVVLVQNGCSAVIELSNSGLHLDPDFHIQHQQTTTHKSTIAQQTTHTLALYWVKTLFASVYQFFLEYY